MTPDQTTAITTAVCASVTAVATAVGAKISSSRLGKAKTSERDAVSGNGELSIQSIVDRAMRMQESRIDQLVGTVSRHEARIERQETELTRLQAANQAFKVFVERLMQAILDRGGARPKVPPSIMDELPPEVLEAWISTEVEMKGRENN